MTSAKYKAGIIALIGRPNTGKSTLLNALMGGKFSITTPIPQTTRKNIRAIRTEEHVQYVFMDTPGIHISEKQVNKSLTQHAVQSLEGCDLIVFLHDITRKIGQEDRYIAEIVKKSNIPCIILLNKIDLVGAEAIGRSQEHMQELLHAEMIIPVSALKGVGMTKILEHMQDFLPYSSALYPKDTETDEHFYITVAEFIREKLFQYLSDELPHAVTVETSAIQQEKDAIVVTAHIYVKKQSQKLIIIGKQGSMIQRIRKSAQQSLQKDLWKKTKKIQLRLDVRMRKGKNLYESTILS